MFKLIDEEEWQKLQQLAKGVNEKEIENVAIILEEIINSIRDKIPEKKRISLGRYSIIKEVGKLLYPMLKENTDVFSFGLRLFHLQANAFVRSLAIQIISIYAEESASLTKTLPIFEEAAIDDLWEVRECSAGFIRKLIKAYPKEMKKWYIEQTKKEDDKARRFAIESIRPVADNKWFKNNREFCFDILSLMYKEKAPYPRTSVGNSLSDWARIDKEYTFPVIEKLAKSGDKNSYWIAYRACRNLIKTDTIRVMDILGVSEYKYKDRHFFRKSNENGS